MSAVYRASTLKRERRTKERLEQLDAQIIAVLKEDHPVLTWCAANATTVRDPAGNRKLDKSRATGRIDGLQALAMAMGAASRAEASTAYAGDGFMFV